MRRNEIKDFSEIVAGIYDCALDPSHWDKLLPGIAAYLKSDTSTFAIYDIADGMRYRYHDFGFSEAAVKSYFETYAPLNPTLEAKSVFAVGEPYTLRMTLTEEEYFGSRFYIEWAKPNRQGDIMGVTALRAATRLATHAVSRLDHRPLYSPAEVNRYRILVPHICRALTISDALGLKTYEADMLTDTLDALRTAVYFVDEDCRVLHMNDAAEAQIKTGDILKFSDRVLEPVDEDARAGLLDAVRSSTMQRPRDRPEQVSLPLKARHGTGCVATVLPLDIGSRRKLARPRAAAAAIFVQDPREQPLFPGEALARLYRLTAGELRVALAIAPGLTAQDVADQLGLSITTVKTHLSRIFAKTGTKGQTDLIVLLQRSSTPVAASRS